MNPTPAVRRLRVLAFDPSLTTRLETETINELTLSIPWEPLEPLATPQEKAALESGSNNGAEKKQFPAPGPIGEYIEVVDYDPASDAFYAPVDLNDPNLLAQDGLAPSESNPQFHQQMVYAVAMTTIRNFERALGRTAFWSDKAIRGQPPQFVRRLRIYPHALRERNAYYSPEKKALLFGYFPVTTKDAYNTPGTIVFSCLSHDIIAHETTHALLDGVHPRFNEPSNVDVYAFHEAFADLVALFQHFSYPSVLESQIQRTHGTLQTENLLSQLAQQFGRATGRGGALRDALGKTNKQTGQWEASTPDPHVLENTVEAHARGAILVAAVFRAFLLMYRDRSADLFRIASNGLGVLPEGNLHPDLVRRLAREAASCADRILQMCIHAIDYCPPVDITFGDFLRGIITADVDYSPEDPGGYRTVFIQSFREWGIYPRGVMSMGLDSLVLPSGRDLVQSGTKLAHDPTTLRNDFKTKFLASINQWDLESDRFQIWQKLAPLKGRLHNWLLDGDSYGRDYAQLFGLVITRDAPATVYRARGLPAFEVHSARPTIRRTIQGNSRTDLVIEITQRRRGYFDPAEQKSKDASSTPLPDDEEGDFVYRSGCTVHVDTATQAIRRIIRTPGTIADNAELERMRRFVSGETGASGNAFDVGLRRSRRLAFAGTRREPFAMLHQQQEEYNDQVNAAEKRVTRTSVR